MISVQSWSRVAVAAALSFSFHFAISQVNPQDAEQQQRRGGRQGGPGMAPGGPPPPGAPMVAEATKPLDEFVKDFTKMPGLFNIYRDKDAIYMEVPESMFGKLFLLQVTSGSGLGDTPDASVFHGMPIDDVAFKIKKIDDSHIAFLQPNLAHRANRAEPVRMIERSFPDSILASFPIRARQTDRHSYLVEVGSFFKSDVHELSNTVQAGGLALDPAGTYIDTLKNFPENSFVHTVFNLVRRAPGAGPRIVPWSVSFNLSQLPEHDDYKPRIGDSRVGFFAVNFQDLDDQSSRDQNVNYIYRWNLQKKDPHAALSEPKKPIVFYIDNAVPTEYRADVKRGLLMWNPAFERIGIKNAIVVKQMPDDADWDIADIRYNVVRWTTGMPFAIALMRPNPLTGEVLNASINFDGVFAGSAAGEFDEIVTPTSLYEPQKQLLPGNLSQFACDIEETSARIGAEGANLLEGLSTPEFPFDKDAYVHQRLTEVVCHEMGHCLGLRHNFIASKEASMAQLSDRNFVAQHGTSASVMDYVPYNTAAIKKHGVDYYQTIVGDYDNWAIQYGYVSTTGVTPEGERPFLSKIAAEDGLPGHRYLSDATADDYDPSDVRYDFSAQPLEWAEKQMDMSRYLLLSASKRRVESGSSYYAFTRTWIGALNTYIRAASYVPRYVGGVNLNNSYKGDPHGGTPISPVDTKEQVKALNLLNTYVFSESAFTFPKQDLAMLTFNPNSPGNEAPGQSRLFPIRSTVSSFQTSTLRRVFTSPTLIRISNNEFRSHDTLSLPALFDSVDHSVWSELSNHHEITELRRELQRDHLDLMESMVLKKDPGCPDDARDLALANLKSLRSRLKAAEATAKGPYGKVHIDSCLSSIDQTLAAQVQVAEEQAAPAAPARRGG